MSVSVVIPAFNAKETVERAIRTVLDQTVPPLEVIVVDDGSTDGSFDVVRKIAEDDRRVRPIRSPCNFGPAKSRNIGFRAACGEWIAIQDADDAWAPDRIEKLLAAALRYDVDLVGDNMLLHDVGTNEITRMAFPPERGVRRIRPIDLFEQDVQLGAEFGYGLLQPIIRRAFLEERGLAYNENLRYGEDMIFLAEILFSGARGVIIPDPLYIYSTRIGEKSRVKSRHSRSIPRFDLIADQIDALKGPYASAISPDIDCAMTRLARRYRVVHELNLARCQRREQGLVPYLVRLGRRPSLVSQMVRQRLARTAR